METNSGPKSTPIDDVRGKEQQDAEELADLSAEATAEAPAAKTLAPSRPDSVRRSPKGSSKTKT